MVTDRFTELNTCQAKRSVWLTLYGMLVLARPMPANASWGSLGL